MKKDVDDLKDELKRLEAEMQKLERSLSTTSEPVPIKEKLAVKEELESRFEILRREERGKELRKQLERDSKSNPLIKDSSSSKD
jgi:hypothetical protein